jgi:PIN domain nuclease of toxin-antitoxin system
MPNAWPPCHTITMIPFDRMLIAQAQIEGLSTATHDERLRPYDIALAWV